MKSTSIWPVTLFAVFALAGCGDNDPDPATVGNETFRVPDERHLPSGITIIPAAEEDVLRFLLDTKPDGSGGAMVSVQNADVLCNLPGADAPNYRGEACNEDLVRPFVTPFRRVEVEHSGGTLWEYFNADGVRVAICSATSDGTGSCTADARFENSVFSIRFQDDMIDDLPEIVGRVSSILSDWRIPADR